MTGVWMSFLKFESDLLLLEKSRINFPRILYDNREAFFYLCRLLFLKDLSSEKMSAQQSAYQKPMKSGRPPLIPTEDEQEKLEEGFFGSLGKLLANTGTSMMEILGGIFPGFRRKPLDYEYQSTLQQKHSNAWPVQESFVIPDEDEPPPTIETRTPTPRKTYPFMSRDAEKMHQLRQSRVFYSGWDDDLQHQQKQQQQQQHHHKYHSSAPHTYYEQSCEKTNEIVFGAVQEQDRRREAVIIKPVEYGDPVFDHHNIRSRINSMSYSYGK